MASTPTIQNPKDVTNLKKRFLMINSSNTGDSITQRLSILHSDMKNQDTLGPVRLRKSEDVLEIRKFQRKRREELDNVAESTIVTINVSGDRYETYLSTLELYPNTLLGNKRKRKLYWNKKTEEYFFDRHRACFGAILYYYQSHGRLRRPDSVPLDTFLEEVSFFELGTEALGQIRQVENISEVKKIEMPRVLWRRYIWYYLEFPQHSLIARLINFLSMLFTILSCIALAIESLPVYNDRWTAVCRSKANLSINATEIPPCDATFNSPFFIIQTICVSFFTIEFLLRFISTPSYVKFVLSIFNWVDLAAIVPYFVFLILELQSQDISVDTNVVYGIRLLRVLRFSRVLKIYLLFQQMKSLRVLSATIRESLFDFVVMLTIMTLIAFMFGSVMYFSERSAAGNVFDSIPKSIYWGVITITGVGYGDMSPVTAIGRAVTCLCALFGPAMMGMMVSVLVDRYQRVYTRKMYINEPELEPVDWDSLSNVDDDNRSMFSQSRGLRKRDFSQTFSNAIASFQHSRKRFSHQNLSSNDQSYKLQVYFSIDNDECNKIEAKQVLDLMKDKLTEAVSQTNLDVNLKLVDTENHEIWNISSFPKFKLPSTSSSTVSLDEVPIQMTRVQSF